ncbi:MAG TPA: tetraacyldisaccharide 4'-kinase [Mariprofundaceae bacterium]|nr:tetraacyldisaccharide 4'-kinase [Mariprofundaceae bacterium]
MKSLSQWVENIWWQQATPPIWLRAFEPIYAQISRRQLERRASRSSHPALPLISVGNITAGGSGKTPFVIWLAGQLREAGHTPVILCRGDSGKSSSEPIQVLLDADPTQVGDEALLLAQQSGCTVISARDRIKASKVATGYGDIIILDDGFQYRHLARVCDIVLVPSEGLGNGHQIPAGPLREPVSALARANLIVRTGPESSEPLTETKEWKWRAEPAGLHDAMRTGQIKPDTIFAATGIARPHRFFEDLESTGLELSGTRTYPDHYRFTASDVATLISSDQPVAVTQKDAVKLRRLWPEDAPLWVLSQHGAGETGLFEAILGHLKKSSTTDRYHKAP